MRVTHTTIFFLKDSRNTALSFNKKAIVHHTPKWTPPPHKQRTQLTQQNATPPQPGRGVESKPPQTAPSSPTLCHAEVAGRSKPERQLELLHQGTITLKAHTHDRRSLCSSGASAEHSHHSTDEKHWSWLLGVGASPLPPPHTPLPRTQISETALKATTSAQPSPGTPLYHER